ncbi:MAG: hypothetical protein IT293_19800 [Deltaproteobacteria bacterium]|nr:hypothetical protein [Deltaproteobacteria bacterium]
MRGERRCERGCLTGESLIETVDGPVAIGGLVGKSITVMTRLPNGRIGFRLFSKIAVAATAVPILRVTFDNDQSVEVDHGHVFYARDGVERPVGSLAPGDLLDSSAYYPQGYVFLRKDGTTQVSAGAVAVATIESAGVADVFGGIVNETGSYFLTAGVRCKA